MMIKIVYGQWLKRYCFWVIGVLATAVACTSPAPPPTANLHSADCFPETVFTPQEMQARVDCHPDEYKMVIDAETAVLFAYPDPILDWVGPVFVIHIPTVSEAVLNVDGTMMFADYKSDTGQAAVEAVLNNPAQMEQILQRAIEAEGIGP